MICHDFMSGQLAQTQEKCAVANTAVALDHQELAVSHQHALQIEKMLALVKTGELHEKWEFHMNII